MITRVQLHQAGDVGVLAEFEPEIDAAFLFSGTRALRERYKPVAVVAGHSSTLMLFETAPTFPLDSLTLDLEPAGADLADEHTIAVSFAEADAPDLGEVLGSLSITRDEFERVITNTPLRVRFQGFLPGFAYLDGLPARWNIPRRATSRTRVPAGSLGIAAGLAGFYPSDSPGGWNIVGRTTTHFWVPERRPPSLLGVGDVVHIVTSEGTRPARSAPGTCDVEGVPTATCLNPGQQSLIVTLPDVRRYEDSLPAGGAFDAALALRANVAVGNAPDAHVIECALVGPELRFERECRVSWEGASVAWEKNGVRCAERVIALSPGDVLRVGRLTGGLRGWLAVSGGTLAAAPPYAAAPGRLGRGETLRSPMQNSADDSLSAVHRATPRTERHEMEIVIGPHRIDVTDLAKVLDAEWVVTPSLDRTGVRLRCERGGVTSAASIPSCGMQVGTVQLHPNGDLVIMGPDHPISGGYVQPFTIVSTDIWKVAQLQPGDIVRWRQTSPEC